MKFIIRCMLTCLFIFMFILPVWGQDSQPGVKSQLSKDLQAALRFERAKHYDRALDIYVALDKLHPDNEKVFEGIQRCYSG